MVFWGYMTSSGIAGSYGSSSFSFFLFFFFLATLFIYLFIFGCVGSSVRARAFSSCCKWGPLFIAVRGPLFIAVRGPFAIAAPHVAGHRLQTRRLSSCGSRAQLLCGTRDLPRPGLEPASPALAGRFSTTAPPGKPPHLLLTVKCCRRSSTIWESHHPPCYFITAFPTISPRLQRMTTTELLIDASVPLPGRFVWPW